jgi:hypothetical protein
LGAWRSRFCSFLFTCKRINKIPKSVSNKIRVQIWLLAAQWHGQQRGALHM